MNEILALGGALAILGSVLALWLVREREIDRAPLEAEAEAVREGDAVPEPAAA
jgi:hypothetical protein